MKKLLNSIKYDIRLNFYNRSIFVLAFFMILTFMFTQRNMLETFKSDLKSYNYTYKEMKESGENVNELLNKEAKIVEEKGPDGGIQQSIDNTLRYDYDNLTKSFAYLKGTNIIVGLLENSTLIFLGLLAGIYMIFLYTYEYSEKTIKTRLLFDEPVRLVVSKFISGIFIVTGVFCFSLIISWIASFIWSEIVLQSVDINIKQVMFDFEKVITSLGITYLIMILFSILGFAIGFLLRNMSTSILVFSVLHLVVPILGKYDYKNLIFTIFSKGYELDITQRLSFVEGVGFIPSILIFLLYVSIIFVFSCFTYIIKKRRGGYV